MVLIRLEALEVGSVKKVLFMFACLSLALLLPENTIMADEKNFVVQINITGGNGEYVVDILDDQYYAEMKPTIFVNTDLDGDLVKVVDENDKEMPSVLVNGEVSFTVSRGGKYFITKGTKRNTPEGKTKRNTTPKYVMPKTGVE